MAALSKTVKLQVPYFACHPLPECNGFVHSGSAQSDSLIDLINLYRSLSDLPVIRQEMFFRVKSVASLTSHFLLQA